jgi:lysophospholipase L1-like esterase
MNAAALRYATSHTQIRDVIIAGYWRRQATGVWRDGQGAYQVDDLSTEVSSAENARVLKRSLTRLAAALPGRTIHVIEDAPEVVDDPPSIAARIAFMGRTATMEHYAVPYTDYTRQVAEANAVLQDLAARKLVNFVRVDDVLCPTRIGRPRVCPIMFGKTIAYRNGDHLSAAGAVLLVDRFALVLQEQARGAVQITEQ